MADEPRIVQDITALDFEDKHILARKALVHKTPEIQVNVYVLEPGGRIPAHQHSVSWDISIVTRGALDVTYLDASGSRTARCVEGAITIVPPQQRHEIVNASPSEPAHFVLIQSPSAGFDFLKDASA